MMPGVIAFDESTGFWMVHSQPRFPKPHLHKYRWVDNDVYGQSFLCISLATDNLNQIGMNLNNTV